VDCLTAALHKVGVKVHERTSEDTAENERLVALTDLGEDLARKRVEHLEQHGPPGSPLDNLITPFRQHQPS
jgi:hypothetical protein